jgi:peptidoglycan/xylan/chitin deacetylase (PgdA/CDA1 family)
MQFAPLFPIIHRILQPAFPSCIWSGDRTTKAIALTFDDGPHPQYTPELLAVLDRYNITASFFGWVLVLTVTPALQKQSAIAVIG